MKNEITIPNLTCDQMLDQVKKDCNLTYLDSDYYKWNYLKDEAGKKFEVMTWKPEKYVTSQQVRDYFNAKGFEGNTACFIEWVRQNKPSGYHASIPEDSGCWRDPVVRGLCVPYSHFGDGRRGLYQPGLGSGWYGDWSFVGFRELPLDTQTLGTSEKALDPSVTSDPLIDSDTLIDIRNQLKRIADSLEKKSKKK